MMWVYSLAIVLLSVPGAVVGVLTLVERYKKWRSNHAKK